MKKFFVVLLCLAAVNVAFAGGIFTNTNQSAQFVRMMSRNASLEVDAIYFNPAGVSQFAEGWAVAFHNQYIEQTKIIENDFTGLNNNTFEGGVHVPIFPNLYAAYKKDRWSAFMGFGVNSGGGSANFENGLPSFEMQFSGLPAMLNTLVPTTAYSVDIAFEGKSMFYGIQAGGAYQINEQLSLSAGLRVLIAKNTYEGKISNVMVNSAHPLINPTGAMMSAVDFLTAAGQAELAAMVSNREVDAEQNGLGFTPILGVNYKLSDKWNFALKYEMTTKLELETETEKDDTGLFPDGETVRQDVPGILGVGVTYAPIPKLTLSLSGNYYFDKNTDWGNDDVIDDNLWEYLWGVEYQLSCKFALSFGMQHTETGVSTEYQNEMTHSMSSNTYGFGGKFAVTDNLILDAGYMISDYTPFSKTVVSGVFGTFTEKYDRENWVVAIGITAMF